MADKSNGSRRNGKLVLHPLKFKEAVKAILEVKPEPKVNASRKTKEEAIVK